MIDALPPAAAQAAPAPAPSSPRAALDARARELIAFLNGGGSATALFAPATLAAVPETKLREVAAQIAATLGKAVAVEAIDPVGDDRARLTIRYERGQVTAGIAVEAAAPYRLTGLRITGSQSAEASLDAIKAALQALPGATGFELARLGDGAPQKLVALQPDRPLAIGSAFKLVILAELVRGVEAGERRWDDMVTLGGDPLPGGGYTQKPAGTQVSLRELAERMISVSDNSATDILLATLGRAKVEAMLPVLGVAEPARLRPFLSTLEMFKLKGLPGDWASRWRSAGEAGRRALVAQIDRQPIGAISPSLFADGKPNAIDIEWLLRSADLIRVMDWLRLHTVSGPAAEARRILAINPGIGAAAAGDWAYVGYKGGSEPGVMNMTLLLQAKDGGWYALTGSWNNPEAAIDEMRFAMLMTRAAALAAKR